MKVTRRDVLTAAGGGVVGIMLTPAPWKLVDDLAIWTQNWKWIPRPPRGPQTVKTTACSLCPQGCAADARCIGGLPVAMRAAAGGTLCSLGLTAHHLPYHPARLAAPVRIAREGGRRTVTPATLDAIVAAASATIRDAGPTGRAVAVLDARPGRSVSWAWSALLGGMPRASVLAAPGREGSSVDAYAALAGEAATIGANLAAARTILSFGAPLAEGAAPATLERVLARDLHLIQVEPLRSQTAAAAGRWVPCRPGTEAHVALAIARALVTEGLADPAARGALRSAELDAWLQTLATTEPPRAAETSVPDETIRAIARELAAGGPALVVAGEQPGGGRHSAETELAVLTLNVLLGAFESGTLARRAALPSPVDSAPLVPASALSRLEDGSVALLLVDASAGDAPFPWPLARRKLAKDALVIALSPFLSGTAAHADYVVPTAAPLEATFELGTPFDAPAATMALSAAILAPRDGATDPATFIRALAQTAGTALPGSWSTSEDLAKLRLARILEAGRGTMVDRSSSATPIASFASADEVWTAMIDGSRWMDEPEARFSGLSPRLSAPVPVPAPGPSTGLALLPIEARDVSQTAAVSPVLTKLYRESALRRSAGTVVLNPATARSLGFADGAKAVLETTEGRARVAIATDESVMPAVAAFVVGPAEDALGGARAGEDALLDICPIDAEGLWRRGTARLVEG